MPKKRKGASSAPRVESFAMRDELYDALLSASDNPSTVLEKDALFQLVAMAHVTGIPIFRLQSVVQATLFSILPTIFKEVSGDEEHAADARRRLISLLCPSISRFRDASNELLHALREQVDGMCHSPLGVTYDEGKAGLTVRIFFLDKDGRFVTHLCGRWMGEKDAVSMASGIEGLIDACFSRNAEDMPAVMYQITDAAAMFARCFDGTPRKIRFMGTQACLPACHPPSRLGCFATHALSAQAGAICIASPTCPSISASHLARKIAAGTMCPSLRTRPSTSCESRSRVGLGSG